MINKRILNIVSVIALLSPTVSTAACLDSNDPTKNRITGDCHSKAEYYLAGLAETDENPPVSRQKTIGQSEFSVFEGAEASNLSSKGGVKQSPKSSETDLGNYEWTPSHWYEVY